MGGIERAGFHLLGAMRRAIGKVFLFFILFLIIGFVLMEALLFFVGNSSSLSAIPLINHIAAVIVGLTLGYAAAITVLAAEAIRFLVSTVRDVEKGVQGELSGGAKILQTVEQAIRSKI